MLAARLTLSLLRLRLEALGRPPRPASWSRRRDRSSIARLIASVFGSVLSAAQGASRVADLLTQLLQIAGESGFHRIGEAAAAQPIRASLQAGAEIVFVHAIERAPQLAGSRRLRGREFARRVAHLLGQARQVIAHLLAIVDHFVDFLWRRILRRLIGGLCGIQLGHKSRT